MSVNRLKRIRRYLKQHGKLPEIEEGEDKFILKLLTYILDERSRDGDE